MKFFKHIINVAGMLLLFQVSYSQNNVLEDSTVSFKVYGECDQCKARIEKAAKGKGVRSAIWNVETKMLSLDFYPKLTTIAKIQNRIVSVGHDLENEKADDKVYQSLPECCHYRELMNDSASVNTVENSSMDGMDIKMNHLPVKNNTIQGIVLEEEKNGTFRPLSGASVIWLGTPNGTTTDSAGMFSILHQPNGKLVISYTGYQPDTMIASEPGVIKVILASGKQLSEVTITNSRRSSYLSAMNPIRTQVMTQKELFKAACCNLSESFETNASVDVSYNDAVTGSKQIQLLGLAGNYTQLTVENLPGPRGIATAWGLNSIPGTWVESIQLSKGVGSVANGYESIAGQINVELKKPENSEKFFSNIYVNDQGKTDINFNFSQKISSKWSTALLLHGAFFNNKKLDFNKDGFRDLPTGNLLTAMNRWKYDDGKGFIMQFGVRVLNDKKTGGQVDFDPSTDKFTTNRYGLGIATKRYEGFSKIGYVFSGKKYKSIGLQLSAFNHQQDSYFGLTKYNAIQQNIYGNLIYQSIIGTTAHKFRTGLSFVSDHYNEDFNSMNYKRIETVPGAFFEYTFTPANNFNIVAGIRADHNSLFAQQDDQSGRGWFATPRLHLRYEPVKGTSIRLSAGRGQRTANIFAENNSVLVSARLVEILSGSNGKAYGFDPEVAWNKGISVDQKFKLFNREATFSVDYFRNDFTRQVVVDMEDPRKVRFYELHGKSYSNSLQTELDFSPVDKLDIRLAYRYFDVKETYGNQLLEKPLLSKNRAFFNASYEIKGWKLDYTFNYNGRKRIPNTSGNPVIYQRSNYSPAYVLMNAQISKSFGRDKSFDVYIGGENLTGFYQKDAIIAADLPFSQYFDASLVWGPVSGRMFYAGLRFKIK